MKLEGAIGEVPLLDQLLELGDSKFTGALRFENDAIIKIIYFKDGDVLSASTNDRLDSIDEILLRAGKITREHIKQALGKRKESETLGDAMLALGYITRKELTWARRAQVLGIVRSTQSWNGGSFTVVNDYLPKREEGTIFRLRQLLLELLVTDQDRERVERELSGGELVLRKKLDFDDRYAALGLNEEADAIVALVDGELTASQIAARSSKDLFNVFKLLSALHQLGLLARKAQVKDELLAVTPSDPVAVPPFSAVTEEPWPVADFAGEPIEETSREEMIVEPTPESEQSGLDGELSSRPLDDDYSTPPPRKSPGGLWLAVLVLFAVAGGLYYWYQRSRNAPQVVAPAVSQTLASSTVAEPAVDFQQGGGSATNPAVIPDAKGEGSLLVAPPALQEPNISPTPAPTAVTPAPAGRPVASEPTRDRYLAMASEFVKSASADEFAIQFELVCQTSSVTRALRSGGDNVWFTPVRFQGKDCFRVYWGRYKSREAATAGIAEIPGELRDSNSQPRVIAIREVKEP